MEIKPTRRCADTLMRMAVLSNGRRSPVLGRVWGNWNPLVLLVGMRSGAAAVEDGLAIPSKFKQSYCMIQNPWVFLSSVIRSHPNVEISPGLPPVGWMDNLWYVLTVRSDSAWKRKEPQTPAAARMDLENITLGERSQPKKASPKTIRITWLRL